MPDVSQVHVDRGLTRVTMERPPQKFIAQDIFPDTPEKHRSDIIQVWDADQEFAREVDDAVESGGAAKQVSRALTQLTYTVQGHALKDLITLEEETNADPEIKADNRIGTTVFLTQKVLLNKEVEAKVKLDAALTGDQTTAAATGGWNGDSGDPVGDIRNAVQTIESATGATPTHMALDSILYDHLRDHPDVIERVVAGGDNEDPADISMAGVARLFRLQKIVISTASKNTAIEGQSASRSRIWNDDAYFAIVVPRLRRRVFTLAAGFQWLGMPGTGNNGFRVTRWFDPDRDGEWVRVKKYYDQKILQATAGFRISNGIQ